MSRAQVTVMGLGYVGLTTALSFSRAGVNVEGFEISEEKADSIAGGVVPFFEPGISELLRECLANGTFVVSDSLEPSEINFISVGTPTREDGSPDLSYIKDASGMLGGVLAKSTAYSLVVVKSTVIPETSEHLVKPFIEEKSGKQVGRDIGLAMNPEFLREGSALQDISEPDRIVIGEFDKRSGDKLQELYSKIYKDRKFPVLRTNLVNAEFIKYASNSFLAMKISFANSIANIASSVPEADVKTIVKGIGYDKRIGESFLGAGIGYGGSCFPKDTKALINYAKKQNVDPILLCSVEEVNNAQPLKVVEMAEEELGTLHGKKIALLGLSFKPKTDDIREAPSLKIIRELLRKGARSIVAYDPVASNSVKSIFGSKIEYSENAEGAIRGADCCIVATEWEEFKKLSPSDFTSLMRTPVVIDGRRIYDPGVFSGAVRFRAIGRG